MTQKTSLREFQQALSRRIAGAATTVREDVRLGVRSCSTHWLLRLPESGAVLPVSELTPVPLTQHWFRGMANVRGTLYSVVDLAAFLGEAPTPRQPQARLILVGQRFRTNTALLVERVLGLRYLRDLVGLERVRQARWAGAEFRDAKGQLWCELDVAALLETPEFLNIAG